jgi:hypothetical protein
VLFFFVAFFFAAFFFIFRPFALALTDVFFLFFAEAHMDFSPGLAEGFSCAETAVLTIRLLVTTAVPTKVPANLDIAPMTFGGSTFWLCRVAILSSPLFEFYYLYSASKVKTGCFDILYRMQGLDIRRLPVLPVWVGWH